MPTQVADAQVIRMPLVGTETGRTISSATSSGASSGVVGVGIVGIMIVGLTSSSTKDQRFINAMPEKIVDPLTGKTTFYLTKRPGWETLSTPKASNAGSAIHIWSGKGSGTAVITTFGATNSEVFENTTSRGSTTGKVLFINDTLIGTTPNLTFVTNNNSAYFYPDAGALTQITDVDFPGNVAGETITGNLVFLDGYAFIMTLSGKVYNSDLNSLSSWSALGFISCNMSADGGIGLARYKDQIVAFGKESTEFFSDVGNPVGSPLQRTANGYMAIGCVSQQTIVQLEDTVAWLGTASDSTLSLYLMEGLQAKRISTPAIEAILSTTSSSGLYLNAAKIAGKTFIFVVSTSDSKTYVYSIEDQTWHEWNGASLLWQHITGIAAGTKFVYAVTEQNTTGKVYIIDPLSYAFQDDGSNYTFSVQTYRWDGNNSRRKFIRKIRVVGDIQEIATPISVAWSDTDYLTTTTARTIDMSSNDPSMTNCGSFRRRAFALSNTSNGPLRLEALEFEIVQGIH